VRTRYRIGTTSFIHPCGWLENVRRLSSRPEIRDVEILVFEPPGEGAGPAPEEIALLGAVARASGMTCSVHAPLELGLASDDERWRRASVDVVRRTVQLTAPLAPHSVIVHLNLDARGAPAAADLGAWRDRAERSLREILRCGIAPAQLCLETLDYDLALAEPLVDALGLSVALDVGHLARDGIGLEPVLARSLGRTRVVHWHGTDPSGRDHRSLRHYPRAEAVRLLSALAARGFEGVITLEVFREDDLAESLAVLREIEAEALGAGPGTPSALMIAGAHG